MSEEVQETVEGSIENNEGTAPAGTGGAQLPTWKYADEVPGAGDVPDWFMADKYKSVAEQARAAHELRKKLGSRAEDAPDEYSIDYDKYGIAKDDVVLGEFNKLFKELNVPQKDYEKIVDKFVGMQKEQAEIMQKQREAAYNAFGPETKETVARLNTWAKNNFSESEQQLLSSFMTSAEEVRLLDKLRAGAPKSAPPTHDQAASAVKHETYAEINNLIQSDWKRFNEDSQWRSMMESKRRAAYLRERSGA